MNGFVGLLRNLGPVKLASIGGALVGLAIFFSFLITNFSNQQMALLFSDLDTKDSASIVTKLDSMEVPYRITGGGTQIHVPGSDVDRLRMMMAKEGIPHGGSVGYEIFDKGDGFGASQFMQNLNHIRALEGELARTISSISSVKSARVHLVFGKKELFSKESQPPSASVVLNMRSSERLNKSEVASIQHLVASAVPGLKTSQISIVDDRGTLLARGYATEEEAAQGNAGGAEMQAQFESKLRHALEDMLERTLGVGSIRAEVTADLDFNRIISNEEIYDPEGQVARSTQTNEETADSTETDGGGDVSVENNTPAGQASGGTSGNASKTKRTEETINYEISKTIKSTTQEIGSVNKISVAVLVDGTYTKNEAGEETYAPRSEEELQQITTLVKSAIGFDEKRGDTVQVVNMKFIKPTFDGTTQDESILGMNKADLIRLGESLGFALVGFLVLLMVVRPILLRAFESVPRSGGVAQEEQLALAAAAAPVKPPPPEIEDNSESEEEDMEKLINIDKVAGKVKASSVRRVSKIIESHPEEAVSVIRGWLHQDDHGD